MHRREVLQFLGSAILTPRLASLSAVDRWRVGTRLHGELAADSPRGDGLSSARLTLVTALSDTLIPRTDTPGAVDVGVPRFIDRLVAEWYPDDLRNEILSGLDAIDARGRSLGGKPFAELDAAGRGAVLTSLDLRASPSDPAEAAWRTLRDQIVFGYVTARPIAALMRTTPIIPGRFNGCVPVGAPQ
jgi:hypothetical protein